MAFHVFGFSDSQKACLAMVFTQLLATGMGLLTKAALNDGMSSYVFVAYRQAIATLILVPFACKYERRKAPPMSFIIFCKIFLLALCGITFSMDIYYFALSNTSVMLATTITNVVPVMTFAVAVLLRVESVDLRRIYGQCKIVGVVVCISGVVVLSLYQGPPLKLVNSHSGVALTSGRGVVISHGKERMKSIEGPLLMLVGFVAWSVWFVMQAQMMKTYPAKLSLTALQCFLSAIQAAVAAVIVNRNGNSWKLSWNIQLFSVVYCGVFISGVSYWLLMWCVEKKGPVYVCMFSPLSAPITAVVSALLWAELLYFGSVLGGVLIVAGLYCVLWGKSKEMGKVDIENETVTSETSKNKLPDLEGG